MKVKDFIKKLKDAGCNDDTEIYFGHGTYGGEWYDFEILDIEYEDSEDETNVLFTINDDYKKEVLYEACEGLKEDLEDLVYKWC